jgi:hypothetical protein
MSFTARPDEGEDFTVSSADELRRALADQQATPRDLPRTVSLSFEEPYRELIVGFRGERGVLYWTTYDYNDSIATGDGDDTGTVTYGLHQILLPRSAELPAPTVIAAAVDFYTSGQRPTGPTWVDYGQAVRSAHVTE